MVVHSSLDIMKIQWIAAAMAQKELNYYCFDDAELAKSLITCVHENRSKSAGDLFNIIWDLNLTDKFIYRWPVQADHW